MKSLLIFRTMSFNQILVIFLFLRIRSTLSNSFPKDGAQLSDSHWKRHFTDWEKAWFHQRKVEDELLGTHVTFTRLQNEFFDSLAPPDFGKRNESDKRKGHRQRRQAIPQSPAVRKEYRMLTDYEREKFHRAVNRVKNEWVDGRRKWDLLTLLHNPKDVPNAHWGPAFLPWHREYLRRVEASLRDVDPDTAIPYWDSTMDQDLPDPRDSIIWTHSFMGNGQGFVTDGPFAHWETLDHLSQRPNITRLYRSLATHAKSALYSRRDVHWILSRSHFRDLSFCEDKTFEMTHGLQHLYVGGFLEPLRQSPNDPAFYIIHSFVDFLWELFRKTRQSATQRETQWGLRLCKPGQNLTDPMHPFPRLLNRDGLSNHYTEDWYKYDDRPGCERDRGGSFHCGSPYLWCDTTYYRCRGKIRVGGNCTGLTYTLACFESECINGVCTDRRETLSRNRARQQPAVRLDSPARSVTPGRRPTRFLTRTIPITTGTPTRKTFPPWSPTPPPSTRWTQRRWSSTRRTSTQLPSTRRSSIASSSSRQFRPVEGYMKILFFGSSGLISDPRYIASLSGQNYFGNSTAHPSAGSGFPEIPGISYIKVRLPSRSFPQVTALLSARNMWGQACKIYCFNQTLERFQPCDGRIRLSLSPSSSDPIAWTHSLETRPYLAADLRGHPRSWKVFPPYINFMCDNAGSGPWRILDAVMKYREPESHSPTIWFPILVLDRRNPYRIPVTNAQATVSNSTGVIFTQRIDSPHNFGLVLLQAENPSNAISGSVDVDVKVRDGVSGQACIPICAGKNGAATVCDGHVRISGGERGSSLPIPFSTARDRAERLGWAMLGHQREWELSLSPLRFYCYSPQRQVPFLN